MSITVEGVKFRRRRGAILLLFLTVVELVFSVLLVISLSANFLFPQRADAVAGVSAKLSYQGRLTDLSGNPLGGATGTNYCFRFSIYDAASGGTKVWPAGTPASTTVKVKDGVFNTDLGTADSLASFNFASNDTLYLQVEVNATPTTCGGTWETLDVRQRIDSVGYARVAEGVYSSILKAPTGGTAVQVGSGSGAATPIFLNLDVKNTNETVGASCSTNGQLWYNSFDSKSRICEAGTIQDLVAGLLVRDEGSDIGRASKALDFTGTGVVVSKGVGANSGVININIPAGSLSAGTATASLGQIVFSNANGVSFGLNGQTLTASVNAGGGGGGATFSNFQWPPGQSSLFGVQSNAFMSFVPFRLPQQLTATRAMLLASFSKATNSSGTHSVSMGIYTRNGSTLSLASSGSAAHTYASATASSSLYAGLRRFSVPVNINATPGEYWYAVWVRSSNAGTMSVVGGAATSAAFSGNFGIGNNSSRQPLVGAGVFSNASFTTAIPSSVAITDIKGNTAGWQRQPSIIFTNFDLN